MRAQGRTAAIAGAVVAVGAATMMGLTGIASATPAGSCLENVNVRAEPSMDAEIVALCEAGDTVDTGETQNGFVRIINLGGWAAEEFIAVDDSTASTPSSEPADSSDAPADEPTSPNTTEPVDGTDDTTTDDGTGGDSTSEDTFGGTGTDDTGTGTGTGDTGTGDTGTDTGSGTDDTGTDAGADDAAEPAPGLGGGLF